MKSRMDKYHNNEALERAAKNNELYDEVSNDTIPSSKIDLIDNVSEIDVSKINDLLNSREGYQRVKNYQDLITKKEEDEDEDNEYDIYEDIENKIYDINGILEEARRKKGYNEEREKRRKLRTTQYNILSKLQLNEVNEEKEPEEDEEMVSDFFAGDKSLTKLVLKKEGIKQEKEETISNTTTDLFSDLKGSDNTILTEPIKPSELETKEIKEEETEEKESNTFYTNVLSFTKEDFEEIHHLQSTVKSNNRLIRILIFILVVVLLGMAAFIITKFM